MSLAEADFTPSEDEEEAPPPKPKKKLAPRRRPQQQAAPERAPAAAPAPSTPQLRAPAAAPAPSLPALPRASFFSAAELMGAGAAPLRKVVFLRQLHYTLAIENVLARVSRRLASTDARRRARAAVQLAYYTRIKDEVAESQLCILRYLWDQPHLDRDFFIVNEAGQFAFRDVEALQDEPSFRAVLRSCSTKPELVADHGHSLSAAGPPAGVADRIPGSFAECERPLRDFLYRHGAATLAVLFGRIRYVLEPFVTHSAAEELSERLDLTETRWRRISGAGFAAARKAYREALFGAREREAAAKVRAVFEDGAENRRKTALIIFGGLHEFEELFDADEYEFETVDTYTDFNSDGPEPVLSDSDADEPAAAAGARAVALVVASRLFVSFLSDSRPP